MSGAGPTTPRALPRQGTWSWGRWYRELRETAAAMDRGELEAAWHGLQTATQAQTRALYLAGAASDELRSELLRGRPGRTDDCASPVSFGDATVHAHLHRAALESCCAVTVSQAGPASNHDTDLLAWAEAVAGAEGCCAGTTRPAGHLWRVLETVRMRASSPAVWAAAHHTAQAWWDSSRRTTPDLTRQALAETVAAARAAQQVPAAVPSTAERFIHAGVYGESHDLFCAPMQWRLEHVTPARKLIRQQHQVVYVIDRQEYQAALAPAIAAGSEACTLMMALAGDFEGSCQELVAVVVRMAGDARRAG